MYKAVAHRAKNSLTLSGLKRLIRMGKPVYVADYTNRILEVVKPTKLFVPRYSTSLFYQYGEQTFLTTEGEHKLDGYISSFIEDNRHSVEDCNCIRNEYNDHFVFEHLGQAVRYMNKRR